MKKSLLLFCLLIGLFVHVQAQDKWFFNSRSTGGKSSEVTRSRKYLNNTRMLSGQKSSLDSAYRWFYDTLTAEPFIGAKVYFEYNPEGLLISEKQDIREFEHQDFKNSSLTLNEYDAFGNAIKDVYWSEWDSVLGGWSDGVSVEIVYTSLGKEASYFHKVWDADQRIWVNDIKNESVYDQFGNLTVKVHKRWDSDNESWDVESEWSAEYNSANLKTSEISKHHDVYNPKWSYVNSSYYSYTNEGLLIDQVTKRESSGSNVGYDKINNEYDVKGNKIKESKYSSTDSLNWIASSVRKIDYDTNENVILNVHDRVAFMDTTNTLVETEREEYVYINNRLQSIKSFYLGSPDDEKEYTYGADGTLLSIKDYNFWDEEDEKWEYVTLEEYTYDVSYTFDDLILPMLDSQSRTLFDYMLLSLTRYKVVSDIGNPEIDDSVSLYYSNRAVGLAETESEKSAFYPNPLTGSSVLKFKNASSTEAVLRVQDVSGKTVFSKSSTGQEFVLHKSDFNTNGLFLYTIQTEGELLSGKLMVE